MEIGEKTYRIQEKLTAVTMIWRNWRIRSSCRMSARMVEPPWSKWIRVSPRIQIVRSNFWDAYQFNSILHLLLWEGLINFYLPANPKSNSFLCYRFVYCRYSPHMGVYLLKWHTPHQIPNRVLTLWEGAIPKLLEHLSTKQFGVRWHQKTPCWGKHKRRGSWWV